jgi:hypothetical protein
MHDTSISESLTEKKSPLCGRGLARAYGPEIPCTLCVRLGPPSVRRKEPTLEQAAICGRKDQAMNTPVNEAPQLKGGNNEEE